MSYTIEDGDEVTTPRSRLVKYGSAQGAASSAPSVDETEMRAIRAQARAQVLALRAAPGAAPSSPISGSTLLIGGAAVLLLTQTSLFGDTADLISKTEKAAGDVIEGAGDLAVGILDMLKLSIIWPKLLFDSARAPYEDIARRWSDVLAATIKLVQTDDYAKSLVYIGYSRHLAIVDPSEQSGNWRNDFAHSLALCRMMDDPSSWGRPFEYSAPPTWANISTVALHKTLPMFAVNGHIYATAPQNNQLLDEIRLGQDRVRGFNVWKDGSYDHSVEGQLEGLLFRLLLWPVEPGTLGSGRTDVLVASVATQTFFKNSKDGANYFRTKAAPLYGGEPDTEVNPDAMGWILKTYVPIGSDTFGDPEPGQYTPNDLPDWRDMNGFYKKGPEFICSTDAMSFPWGLVIAPTDADVRTLPDGMRIVTTTTVFSMDMRHVSGADASGWDMALDTKAFRSAPQRTRTFPRVPSEYIFDLMKLVGTTKQYQIALTKDGDPTVFGNRVFVPTRRSALKGDDMAKTYRAYDPETDNFDDEKPEDGWMGSVRHTVRARPITAVVTSAALGFGVGYMIGKGSTATTK